MPQLSQYLILDKCPHCSVNKPNIQALGPPIFAQSHDGTNKKVWCVYCCTNCGQGVLASAYDNNEVVLEIYPSPESLSPYIPESARYYLQQAIDTVHAPSGSVMLSASAVDAMLKEKEYKDGNLYSRINKAAENNLITSEMAQWAHQVRLDANDQRHVDSSVPYPDTQDALRSIEFAKALAEFLFVLPSKVSRGLKESE